MKYLLSLATLLPLAAQISGPQLGFIAHRGDLRRLEGLSRSSRLSNPIPGLPACSRLDAGSRFAVCATSENAVLAINLRDLSLRAIPGANPAYERIVWSPNGSAVALDSQIIELTALESSQSETASIAAISDTGAAAVRDAQGALRLHGEIVASEIVTAAAFDGEALLAGIGSSLRRIEPGRSSQDFPLPFEPRWLTSDANAFYAANARAIARIDRSTGGTTLFEVPEDEVTIARLDRLADGSLLVALPAENQPGWLFRDGRFSFIPGIAARISGEAAQ